MIVPASDRMFGFQQQPRPQRGLAAHSRAARGPGAAAVGRDCAVAAHHADDDRSDTPSVSATICATLVNVPWPWSVRLVMQRTVPDGSSRKVQPSWVEIEAPDGP